MLNTTLSPTGREILLSISYPEFGTVCFIWQHHAVLQTSATALKNVRIGPQKLQVLWAVPHQMQKIVWAVTYILNLHFKNRYWKIKSGTSWC